MLTLDPRNWRSQSERRELIRIRIRVYTERRGRKLEKKENGLYYMTMKINETRLRGRPRKT